LIRDLDLINNFIELYETPVILYGAGYIGKIALKILNGFSIKPIAFCDTNSAFKGDRIEGIIIKSLDDVLNLSYEKNVIIIITTMATKYKEIESILNKNSMHCRHIYTFTGLLYATWFNMRQFCTDSSLYYLKKVWLHNQSLNVDYLQARIGLENLIINENQKESNVIIFQPGKVGSNTIANSFRQSGINFWHSHGIAYPTKYYNIGQHELRESVINSIKLMDRVKIITLVREPIAKDIGHFFQKIDFELPDAGWFVKGIIEENIQRSFYNYLSVTTPYDFTFEKKKKEYCKRLICHVDAIGHYSENGAFWGWFDEELYNNFGIDILSIDFDQEKGYSISTHNNIELLILKLEKLNELEEVIKEFISNDKFKIINSNLAENKSYMYAYKQFQEELILPQKYVDFYYKNNSYTNHFYSEEERMIYHNKWNKHIKSNV